MTTHNANSMAAAELADRYIETVLATKPELLISKYLVDEKFDAIPAHAQRLAQFRLELINQFSQQPLASFEED